MKFAEAMEQARQGAKISRAKWQEKGDIWLTCSPGFKSLPAENFWSPHNRAFAIANGGFAEVLPSMTLKNAKGQIQMGWIASKADMFADDWKVLEPPIQN